MTKIREVFTSIQGEGPYIGYKQLFIRFCTCNLHCRYCDTDFMIENAKEYSVKDLLNICENNTDCFSVSLTGGEPLLNIDFLQKFLPVCPLPVYLETNGTLYKELEKIIEYVKYIACDIKIPSCTKLEPLWDKHEKFIDIAKNKLLFAKVVFDKEISDEEILKTVNLCKKYDIEIILQPKMNKKNNIENAFGQMLSVTPEFMTETLDKFLQKYNRVRLIPQVHKFLNLI